ncbi:pinopsin-like [Arapaima gigas]
MAQRLPINATGTSDGAALPWEPLSRTGHTVVALFLGLILVLGLGGNALALLVFARFRPLRTPINLILLNISASDLLVCALGTPLSLAASVRGTWQLGARACAWYGFANALFGETRASRAAAFYQPVSFFFFLEVAFDRLVAADLRGDLHYGPEGPGTTCSVQWHQRSASGVSYIICLFVFCLLLPLGLMVFCYSRILITVRGVAKVNETAAQRREKRILAVVVCMVSCYLLCWMPYGVVALLAAFGHAGLITPVVSVVPSVLAKSSTVFNPVIYLLLNNQFYRCFIALVKCEAEEALTLQSSRPKDCPIGVPPPQPDSAPGGPQTRGMQRSTGSLVLVVLCDP